MGHRAERDDFGFRIANCEFKSKESGDRRQEEKSIERLFRIAKPGTRPKGGSPKDNYELRI